MLQLMDYRLICQKVKYPPHPFVSCAQIINATNYSAFHFVHVYWWKYSEYIYTYIYLGRTGDTLLFFHTECNQWNMQTIKMFYYHLQISLLCFSGATVWDIVRWYVSAQLCYLIQSFITLRVMNMGYCASSSKIQKYQEMARHCWAIV